MPTPPPSEPEPTEERPVPPEWKTTDLGLGFALGDVGFLGISVVLGWFFRIEEPGDTGAWIATVAQWLRSGLQVGAGVLLAIAARDRISRGLAIVAVGAVLLRLRMELGDLDLPHLPALALVPWLAFAVYVRRLSTHLVPTAPPPGTLTVIGLAAALVAMVAQHFTPPAVYWAGAVILLAVLVGYVRTLLAGGKLLTAAPPAAEPNVAAVFD